MFEFLVLIKVMKDLECTHILVHMKQTTIERKYIQRTTSIYVTCISNYSLLDKGYFFLIYPIHGNTT
jgi:hypothetical protein